MMRNNIYHIAEVELKKYLPKETEKNKIVCIDLKRIKNWKEYSIIVENALEFPRPVEGSPNRFLDWMRDLTWYDYDRYDIVIYHYNHFVAKNPNDAHEIYDEFKKFILPFWEYEVSHTVVDGKPKDFNVYFIE